MNIFYTVLRSVNLWAKIEIVGALILAIVIATYALCPPQSQTKSSSIDVTPSTIKN